jgi:hypothetical protein
MIAFTKEQVLFSIIYAAIYGLAASVVYNLSCALISILKSLPQIFRQAVCFDKIFPLPRFDKANKSGEVGGLIVFASIISFSFGFLLLSYFALDGCIRLYMLIITSASFFVSNIVLWTILESAVLALINIFLKLTSIIIRCVIVLFRKIFGFVFINH